MVGAAIVHARRNEPTNVIVNIVLLALAARVAGQARLYTFTSQPTRMFKGVGRSSS
jgi:hypothetical protein